MSATGVTVSAGYERPPEQAEPAHCQRTFGILGLVTLGIVLGRGDGAQYSVAAETENTGWHIAVLIML